MEEIRITDSDLKKRWRSLEKNIEDVSTLMNIVGIMTVQYDFNFLLCSQSPPSRVRVKYLLKMTLRRKNEAFLTEDHKGNLPVNHKSGCYHRNEEVF